MSANDSNDVVYPWEEPGDEQDVAEVPPPQSADAAATDARASAPAVLEQESAAARRLDAESDEPSDGEHTGASPRERPIAPKEYYSISEVCDLVDLKPHVLRYWETQFAVLNPSKNRSGNRVYQRKEIKLILLVKHLLYEEKYTVEGAKQKLEQLRRGGELGPATTRALEADAIELLRTELHRLSEILTAPDRD